ncbi:murein hydrolase activator EnvC family protein [Peredibacter starrii]|uniref:Peptidoglycan DD-metalloendopeptidase family protein n=1 Tax=Peredibacter starrii TaxID=28202 RepID=A0AAX4HMF4_9BACT|nr:peptidoglycan DD-metalloendopeptidase family protein [Peredibacter starrii]WPU64450.1 peptidoglycan DD-metalloendopeptidase family protein [Peredibacter starrii]
MRLSLILALTISISASAAVRRPTDELARYRTEVMEMGARLSTLEKEIGSKNNLYLSSIEQIKQFEGDIKLYREALKKKQVEVLSAQAENKRILKNYLLESENETTEPWQRKVHLELLKQAQNKLKNKETELASFNAKVAEFDVKLVDLRKNEEELSQVIQELEARKKTAMDSYLTKVEKKKKMESVVQVKKLEKRIAVVKKELSVAPVIEKKPDRFFHRPVDDYLSFTASPKGVTFKYQSAQPVKAVGGGKVVFAGDLAAYGQVVLIDHGNDLRTVLLGKMNVRVKKNDSVHDGDILAYTLNDTAEPQNLYFEVRKKNTAQNTILWLEQSGVSKI